jgi:acetyl/propionyl-CoA carboxylase alpha subunit
MQRIGGMTFIYQHNGQTYTVRLERAAAGAYTATIGERTFPVEAQPLNAGGWLLTIGGRRVTVYGAAEGNGRYLHLNGQNYILTVPDERAKRRRTTSTGSDLTAQMPGQVVDVLVAEGDEVYGGQTLVLLEAMKMQIRVISVKDGRVRRLLVSKGMVVERGQLLVEIDPYDQQS